MKARNIAILLVGVVFMAGALSLKLLDPRFHLLRNPGTGWPVWADGFPTTAENLVAAAFFAEFLMFLVALVLLTIDGVKRFRKKHS